MAESRFWERFQAFCKAKGVTFTEAAKGADVNRSSLFNWKNKMPSKKSLEKVAGYFGVSTDYFLNGSDVRLGEAKPSCSFKHVEEVATASVNSNSKSGSLGYTVHEVNVLAPRWMVANANSVLNSSEVPDPNCPKTELTIDFRNGVLMDISVERMARLSGNLYGSAVSLCLYEPTVEAGDVLRRVLGEQNYRNAFLGEHVVSYGNTIYIARIHDGGQIKAAACIPVS